MINRKCRQCKVDIIRNPKYSKIQWESVKFCSIRCKDNSSRLRLNCGCCNKEIVKTKSLLLRSKSKILYCDRQCKTTASTTKKQVSCLSCNKTIVKNLCRIKRNNNNFCSEGCRSIFTQAKEHGVEINIYKEVVSPFIQNVLWKQRKSSAYKRWRRIVLIRDNFTCLLCGSREQLEVDHIKRFSIFPNLALVVDNGRTLCNPCHKKITYESNITHRTA